jgi:hydroxymethylbilane synthase
MKKRWTIGTRGSKLALRQTHIVMEELQRQHADYEFIIKTIKTTGDTVWNQPLHLIGGKGLFVKEIEEQLLDKEIDMAVHSVKDLPAELEEGLHLGAVLQREDPRDAFISSMGKKLLDMTTGSRIGTGSLRRKAQILNYNRTLEIVPVRGNIDTRLRKLETEKMDGIVLAAAGIKRMGLEKHITEILPLDIMIPSCGQGAIGIEIRAEEDAKKLLEDLNDEKTFQEISIERRLLKMIGGGCHLPLGIHASISSDNTVSLYISMGGEDSRLSIHEHYAGDTENIPLLISEAFQKIKKFLA